MRITKDRLALLMALLFFTFGCKGAGAAFQGLGMVAVTALRVATVVAAVSASHSSGAPAAYHADDSPPPPPAPPSTAALDHAAAEHPRLKCVELRADIENGEEAPPQKTYVCGKHVIVQDPETGLWHEHR